MNSLNNNMMFYFDYRALFQLYLYMRLYGAYQQEDHKIIKFYYILPHCRNITLCYTISSNIFIFNDTVAQGCGAGAGAARSRPF